MKLPKKTNWWRILFHLAWHFPKPQLLAAYRSRLVTIPKHPIRSITERVAQLWYPKPTEAYPGLLYSITVRDAYASSLAAVDYIIELLTNLTNTTPESPSIEVFRELHKHFTDLSEWYERAPDDSSFKVIKCANSFECPPASDWANFRLGGCPQVEIELSSFESDFELAVYRGSTTELFSQECERAGQVLPRTVQPQAIMFSRLQVGPPGIQTTTQAPSPVFHRTAKGKWIGHVVSTLQCHRPDLLETEWCSNPDSHELYGFTRMRVNFFAASVLCIELSGFLGPRKKSKKSTIKTTPAKKRGRKPYSEGSPRHQQIANLYRLIKNLKQDGLGAKSVLQLAKRDMTIVRQAEELRLTIDENFIKSALRPTK